MVKGKDKNKELWEKLEKILEKSDKAFNLAINVGLAYAGVRVFNDWKGALIGPIALKLAQSDNLVAGGAGVVMLTGLGFCIGSSGIQHFLQDPMGSWNRDMEALTSGEPVYTPPNEEGLCENGRVLMERQGVRICVDSWRVMGYERWGWHRI